MKTRPNPRSRIVATGEATSGMTGWSGSTHRGVVLLGVDRVARVVQPMAEHPAIMTGQGAVVAHAHGAFLMTDRDLAALQAMGFARGQVAGPDALVNALLLAMFALIDRLGGRGQGGGQAGGGENADDEGLHGVCS